LVRGILVHRDPKAFFPRRRNPVRLSNGTLKPAADWLRGRRQALCAKSK
jgi:hypothetical protein